MSGTSRMHAWDCDIRMRKAYKQAKTDERAGDYVSADWALRAARAWRHHRDWARKHGGWWSYSDWETEIEAELENKSCKAQA